MAALLPLQSLNSALNAAGRGLNIGELVTSISNLGTSITNMGRGFGQFILGAFANAQNTLSQIFNAMWKYGLWAFFFFYHCYVNWWC